MKKALVFLMTAVMALNVCACGGKAETAKQETAEEKTVEEEAAVDTAAQEEEAFKPEKDISFIVGFDAGGTADIPARIVAKYMSKYAGVNVVVSNITGSGGQVAAEQVKAMDPDGYTLLHVPVGYYLQAALGNADFTYEDFTPVTMWCDSWVALAVKQIHHTKPTKILFLQLRIIRKASVWVPCQERFRSWQHWQYRKKKMLLLR